MLSTESCTASPRARPFGGGASQPATRAALCSILRWRGLLLRRPTRNSSGSRPDAQSSDGALEVAGRSWQEDGTLSARYWSEAAKEKKDPSG